MTDATTTTPTKNPLTTLLTGGGFIFVLRIFLAGLFIYSSFHKVQNPHEFAFAVRGYKMIPIGLSNIFALFLAWSELVAGILLLLGIMTKKAAGAIFIMLVMFNVALISTIVRGIAVDCGCFSNEGGHQTDYTLVIRNLFLLVAAAMVVIYDRGFWALGTIFGKKN